MIQFQESMPGQKPVTERPLKLHLFFCAIQSGLDDLVSSFKQQYGDDLKPIRIPCAGKLDLLYLTKAFETGADGVVMVTCGTGECRYLEGNVRARKRAEAVDELLAEIGMGRGRVAVIDYDAGCADRVYGEIAEFREHIAQMSPDTVRRRPIQAPQDQPVREECL
jgi:F420-non-reducing hydrogenase iron-sulfur subunit